MRMAWPRLGAAMSALVYMPRSGSCMNKAFVREPEADGRAYCPRCGSLGFPVGRGPLDAHIRPEARGKLGDSAWYCGFPRCEVAYFNLFDMQVGVSELKAPVYPHDLDAPICACFGL